MICHHPSSHTDVKIDKRQKKNQERTIGKRDCIPGV